jgi:anti-sigma-K factor RskA
LSPEEARAFEAFLAANPDAQREVAEYREVGALLALGATGLPGATPSADLRARTLARATAGRVAPIRSPRGWVPWTALAASILVAVGLAYNQSALHRQLVTRDSTITTLRQTVAAREQKIREREAELDQILAPGVSLTQLASTQAPEPGIQLFWNHRTNVAMVHAFRLTPANAKRVYQLWFIPKKGKPIPSVTFNSEPDGHAMVQQVLVPEGQELVAAAITDEPEGGSPQPTTPVVLVGSFVPVKS